MTTTAQQLTQGSLRLKPPASSARPNPEAWKALVGNKPVSARFSLLPNTKPRMGALGTSLIIQICLAAFLVAVPLLFPEQMMPKVMYMVTSIEGPPLDIPAPPPPKPPKAAVAKVKVEPPPPPIEKPAPKVNVARFFAPRIEAPKPKIRQVEADLPKVNDTFQPLKMEIASNQPARPREPVKTGMMTSGSSAVPTIESKPLDKVQTGGFGDPDGLTGPSNPNKRANVAQFGNPALPGGPGYGNGTGGANGARGIVASTGFGNGVAIPPSGRRTATVQAGGFSNQNDQVVEAPKKKLDDGAAAVEPVVILAKPKPVYSAEALKLNLEGEVLLDVVFPASGGAVQVNRIVKGLGHGLDEAAVRAAEQIKYKPAVSSGHPVEFPAVIHIVFQIAY
jgi:outer membrane biosynthesis protein TonB